MKTSQIDALAKTQKQIDERIETLQNIWKSIQSSCSALDLSFEEARSQFQLFLLDIDGYQENLNSQWDDFCSSTIQFVQSGYQDLLKAVDYIASEE
ncbi:hypothetical protein GEMRC1_008354 [Eukaryota sp. GEM-RC1]